MKKRFLVFAILICSVGLRAGIDEIIRDAKEFFELHTQIRDTVFANLDGTDELEELRAEKRERHPKFLQLDDETIEQHKDNFFLVKQIEITPYAIIMNLLKERPTVDETFLESFLKLMGGLADRPDYSPTYYLELCKVVSEQEESVQALLASFSQHFTSMAEHGETNDQIKALKIVTRTELSYI